MPCCSALDAAALTNLYANPLTATATAAGGPPCICGGGAKNVCTPGDGRPPCSEKVCRWPDGKDHPRPLCPKCDHPSDADLALNLQEQPALVKDVLPAVDAAAKMLKRMQGGGKLAPDELEWLRGLKIDRKK